MIISLPFQSTFLLRPSALLSLCRDVSLPTEKPGKVCAGRWTDHVGDTVLLHQTKAVASQHWPTSGKGKLRNKEWNWVCSTVSRGTVSRPSWLPIQGFIPCTQPMPSLCATHGMVSCSCQWCWWQCF